MLFVVQPLIGTPLLQRWFNDLGGGAPPYRLYAPPTRARSGEAPSVRSIIPSRLQRGSQAHRAVGRPPEGEHPADSCNAPVAIAAGPNLDHLPPKSSSTMWGLQPQRFFLSLLAGTSGSALLAHVALRARATNEDPHGGLRIQRSSARIPAASSHAARALGGRKPRSIT